MSNQAVLVIHGPNLHLLGSRDPVVYGAASLEAINRQLRELATQQKARIEVVQSNHEGQIVELIGRAKLRFSGIVLNAAGYTHTSVAIRDAIEACGVPVLEVHLSNPAARECFRRESRIAAVCRGSISGLGALSYRLAFLAVLELGAQSAAAPAAPAPASSKPRKVRRPAPSRKAKRRK